MNIFYYINTHYKKLNKLIIKIYENLDLKEDMYNYYSFNINLIFYIKMIKIQIHYNNLKFVFYYLLKGKINIIELLNIMK